MGNIYERILSLCKAKGVKPAEMCRGAGITPNTMTELKSGRSNGITMAKANRIAAYFGITVSELINGEDAETDPLQILKEDERTLLHSYRTMTDEQKQLMSVFIKGLKND